MSRLICYFGQNPYQKWYWRYGILFTHELTEKKSKALITANWENEFTITVEAETTADLEMIFIKIMLSYYNQPLTLNDVSKAGSSASDDNSNSPFLNWLDQVRSDDINMSFSLGDGPGIPFNELKKRIKLQKATFDYTPKKGFINQEFHPKEYLVKVFDFIPYLRYLTNTKEFESKYHPKKIFVSYSHADSDVLTKLQSHFKLMDRAGLISTWCDRQVDIGIRWDDKIELELRTADIVILLISDNFFSSNYIWEKELPIIEEKISNETAIIVPILCRHCVWGLREPFRGRFTDEGEFKFNISSLQGLPIKNSKLAPIHSDSFHFKDEAYSQIAEKIYEYLEKGIAGIKMEQNRY